MRNVTDSHLTLLIKKRKLSFRNDSEENQTNCHRSWESCLPARLEIWPKIWIPCGTDGNSKAHLLFHKLSLSTQPCRKMRRASEGLRAWPCPNGNRALTLRLTRRNRLNNNKKERSYNCWVLYLDLDKTKIPFVLNLSPRYLSTSTSATQNWTQSA